ncbi:MAG TPA: DUF447 domain-containing protein [Methylophilaceae bacterium]|nr:DUF447 domain-containing protein [Methylophilaceae bacterium]
MILETIVISIDAQGNPHIAPFGVRERDGLILIAPFRPSSSLDNLLGQGVAVLNLTDDVRVFAGALTGRRTWPLRKADQVNCYVLDAALAHSELELIKVKEDESRPELYFRVVHTANHAPFRGFNRAQAAVVELAVLVSRLHMLPIEKINAEISYLKIAIEKTAGERELEAWDWLMECIENHQAIITGENQA